MDLLPTIGFPRDAATADRVFTIEGQLAPDGTPIPIFAEKHMAPLGNYCLMCEPDINTATGQGRFRTPLNFHAVYGAFDFIRYGAPPSLPVVQQGQP